MKTLKIFLIIPGLIFSIIISRPAFPVDQVLIVADTNRDGKVSFDDDMEGRNQWSESRGAIFMFNNDSDQNTGNPDHADKVIDGTEDLKDLAVLLIKQTPNLDKNSKLYMTISTPARPYVQLFYKSGNDYLFIREKEKQELPVQLLQNQDLELRIEANSYPCPGWDGEVTVTARLKTGGKVSTDSVRLRVAPFIMLSALQEAQRLYVREFPGKNEAFIKGLTYVTKLLAVELRTIPAGTYDAWNIWLQDVMEIGYSQTPAQCNHVVLKANRGKSLDEMPRQKILGPDHGWFKIGEFIPATGKGRGGDSWLDWYGNLEVTPPLPGKPFGRIFHGYNRTTGKSLNPQIVKTLEAQGVQTPLIKIHTGWLLIKHVDEIFNFIPAGAGEAKGFKVLVPDVGVTYRLLEQWDKQGKGALPFLEKILQNETISTILNNRELREYNLGLQEKEIEESIGMMKQAIGITETEIIRIPALFEKAGGFAGALMPNMVNSVYMNGSQLMSDPRGPVEQGKDLLQEYVKGLLKKEKIEVYFLDDLPYHMWGGNVHCATNVTREIYSTPWWQSM